MGNNVARQIKRLEISLTNMAKKARRAGDRRMKRGAIQIMERAIDFAPVDEGNLEDAIQIEISSGLNNRNVYEIYIDESAVGSNGADTVGQYATMMHEGIGGSSPYKLGRLSARKDQQLGGSGQGTYVGRKFLDRAFDKERRAIEESIEDAILRELR